MFEPSANGPELDSGLESSTRIRAPLPRCAHKMAPGFCVVVGCPHKEQRITRSKTTASKARPIRCRRCGSGAAQKRHPGARPYCGPCQARVDEINEAREVNPRPAVAAASRPRSG